MTLHAERAPALAHLKNQRSNVYLYNLCWVVGNNNMFNHHMLDTWSLWQQQSFAHRAPDVITRDTTWRSCVYTRAIFIVVQSTSHFSISSFCLYRPSKKYEWHANLVKEELHTFLHRIEYQGIFFDLNFMASLYNICIRDAYAIMS